MRKMPQKILFLMGVALMAFSTQAQNSSHGNERDPDGTWRFHMVQNGRVMTADDFSAWMSQRGLGIQNGKSIHVARSSSFSSQTQAVHLNTAAPSFVQQANWEPAVQPINTAPQRRPQLDNGGHLTGYDSSWEGGHSAGYYSSGRHTSESSQSSGSRTELISYDSGRDY